MIDSVTGPDSELAELFRLSAGTTGRALPLFLVRGINAGGSTGLEFFRPIIEGLGYRVPTLRLPLRPMYGVGYAWEWLHRYGLAPEPQVTRLHCMKAAVSSNDAPLPEAPRVLRSAPDSLHQ